VGARLVRRALASDAIRGAAGNASEAWNTAWRQEGEDSTTDSDRSPGDAFPASSSGLAAAAGFPHAPAVVRLKPDATYGRSRRPAEAGRYVRAGSGLHDPALVSGLWRMCGPQPSSIDGLAPRLQQPISSWIAILRLQA